MLNTLRKCRGVMVGDGAGNHRPIEDSICDSHVVTMGRDVQVDRDVPVHRGEG
jgi:hypothetical protein